MILITSLRDRWGRWDARHERSGSWFSEHGRGVYCASSFFSAKVGPPRHGELRLLASALGRMIKISAVLSPGTSDA
jgi:hypothetical protein